MACIASRDRNGPLSAMIPPLRFSGGHAKVNEHFLPFMLK
ncbi:hypothetical protein B4135_4038 [Caldibacillus debilis]|uniref:Uncharacterized protein n=1 Tax=Caldibacillus debilis TaxID=301148 RepID=A0A150L7N7_9BACI|nr:hypothetical protein B4135_4038 [Caldibacillus debilis]